ncbi:MAG: hypothetical protein Q8K24_05975 [Hydrogenophaga sp.]|nr:hypothetical protein [Hydrogenophaga sp.]
MSASLATRRACLLAERDMLDAGGGGALHLYGGTMEPNPETAASSAPLVIVALPVPAFQLHPTAAQMTLSAQGNAALAGQVTWARFVDGEGNPVRDCTAGPPGSGAQVIVTDGKTPPSALVYTGGEVTVTVTFVY